MNFIDLFQNPSRNFFRMLWWHIQFLFHTADRRLWWMMTAREDLTPIITSAVAGRFSSVIYLLHIQILCDHFSQMLKNDVLVLMRKGSFWCWQPRVDVSITYYSLDYVTEAVYISAFTTKLVLVIVTKDEGRNGRCIELLLDKKPEEIRHFFLLQS